MKQLDKLSTVVFSFAVFMLVYYVEVFLGNTPLDQYSEWIQPMIESMSIFLVARFFAPRTAILMCLLFTLGEGVFWWAGFYGDPSMVAIKLVRLGMLKYYFAGYLLRFRLVALAPMIGLHIFNNFSGGAAWMQLIVYGIALAGIIKYLRDHDAANPALRTV